MYRLHSPDISLTNNCTSALKKIQSAALAVAILTDGRTVTQRLKLNALGLSDWNTYISEDYGSAKPAPDRFFAIQKDHPADQYVYIADNVAKDFLGCNPLGWVTIGMRGTDRNIHSQSTQGLSAQHLPAYWVDSWDQLTELLLKS
jgi:putative hydrolase of the HAD superfamily